MEPSEVREAILAQHEELRGLLHSLEELARRAAKSDDACVPALREIGVHAHDKLIAHLDFEDRYLVPAIRDAEGWGEERANLLAREHVEQRELFRYILERLRDTNRASILLGRELVAFVEVLRSDMEQEEQTVLDAELLRDDVVGIDVESG